MTVLSRALLNGYQSDCSDMHLLDLKASFRGRFSARKTLKLLLQKLDPIIIDHILIAIASLGRIHCPKMASNA